MVELDLLTYQDKLKTRTVGDRAEIFDPVRSKWLVLQPEEMVRQLFLAYCIAEGVWPVNLIGIERRIILYGTERRYDIAMYNSDGSPQVLVECKAHNVALDTSTLEQVSRYNLVLKVPYLIITNGLVTRACKIDFESENWSEIDDIPRHHPGH